MFQWTVAMIVLALVSTWNPGEAFSQGTEVTLKGNILCAHCLLGEGAKCQTAIQVKENDKTVTYYFIDKGVGEPYHRAVCGGGAKAGSVSGVVTEKDGKKWITPKKVDYAAGKSTRVGSMEEYGTAATCSAACIAPMVLSANREAVTCTGCRRK